jgi:hypothetical protein
LITLEALAVDRYEPVMGKINCRLCLTGLPLRPVEWWGSESHALELDTWLRQEMDRLIEEDDRIKEEEDPQNGIFWVDPRSRALRRITV